MNSVLDTLQMWARKARASAGMACPVMVADPLPDPGTDPVAYRLRSWPELGEAHRTARVYRLMSTMTVRPVNRRWMLWQSQMRPVDLDDLLRVLDEEKALEVIDLAARRTTASTAVAQGQFIV